MIPEPESGWELIRDDRLRGRRVYKSGTHICVAHLDIRGEPQMAEYWNDGRYLGTSGVTHLELPVLKPRNERKQLRGS